MLIISFTWCKVNHGYADLTQLVREGHAARLRLDDRGLRLPVLVLLVGDSFQFGKIPPSLLRVQENHGRRFVLHGLEDAPSGNRAVVRGLLLAVSCVIALDDVNEIGNVLLLPSLPPFALDEGSLLGCWILLIL